MRCNKGKRPVNAGVLLPTTARLAAGAGLCFAFAVAAQDAGTIDLDTLLSDDPSPQAAEPAPEQQANSVEPTPSPEPVEPSASVEELPVIPVPDREEDAAATKATARGPSRAIEEIVV